MLKLNNKKPVKHGVWGKGFVATLCSCFRLSLMIGCILGVNACIVSPFVGEDPCGQENPCASGESCISGICEPTGPINFDAGTSDSSFEDSTTSEDLEPIDSGSSMDVPSLDVPPDDVSFSDAPIDVPSDDASSTDASSVDSEPSNDATFVDTNPEPEPICGDGECWQEETLQGCPEDCGICGDNICSSIESLATCLQDCTVCGDDICSATESVMGCPDDCGACGDGLCDPSEDLDSCLEDCVGEPDPSNGIIGFVEGYDLIPTNFGNIINIKGWACNQGWEGSVHIQIVLGQGSPLAIFETDLENEQSIYDQCGTTAGTHRFEYQLSLSDMSQNHGDAIYVNGLVPGGNGSTIPLTQSGAFTVPIP